MKKIDYSRLLKVSIFATGLSGIVAEYVLATTASYFLGDSVFQWTIILSLMLFSMGLGSRFSKKIESNLIESYILLEFLLSLITSFSVIFLYGLMPVISSLDVVIYGLSMLVGFLIGIEIPLVTRINSEYEGLKTNISGMMENDYYGSLVGGLFFAFIGIRFLGLTYTPFVVGGVNLMVAIILLFSFTKFISKINAKKLRILGGVITTIFILGIVFSNPIVEYGNQSRFGEKVVFTEQTPYQQITITQWKDDYQLYLNQGKQLSTFDEWLYHEPLVHPVMSLVKGEVDVLIMGAGDGCAIRELLKHDRVKSITLVDLDSAMTNLGREHPIFRKLNQDAFFSKKVKVINTDAFHYLESSPIFFDVIIADFPDPRTVELNKLYSYEFYKLCGHRLRPNGAFITQSTSPYYTTHTFRCINKTLQKAGFNTLPIHNHVYSFGEWSWIIGSKNLSSNQIKTTIQKADISKIDKLKWMTKESLLLITSFGKDLIEVDTSKIEFNTIHNPVAYKYYEKGDWSFEF
ncbi:polyamine aminopropyltransferase [Crocinitomix catalasitica]|uniref:polyamine aminopropyltransferase n=1 Tax=Crocinitomix catalasitica TaxID=184607 RepID=UPI000B0E4F05|nr:polyamine aminopropyltransferase [Crocinitomix catalasitica]